LAYSLHWVLLGASDHFSRKVYTSGVAPYGLQAGADPLAFVVHIFAPAKGGR